MFTEYKYDKEQLKERLDELVSELRANKGNDVDFIKFACGVIDRRLKKDPKRYLDYGVYWWALKDVLKQNGFDYGDERNELYSREYDGYGSQALTIVAAEQFSEEYLANNVIYTSRFILDESGEWYTIFDNDLEELAKK